MPGSVHCARNSQDRRADHEVRRRQLSARIARSLPRRGLTHTVERMPPDPLAHPEEAIRRLYAYVAYRIGPGPDAKEDVVSDTVERALRHRASCKPSAGTPIAWMIGIARPNSARRHRAAPRTHATSV